MKCQEKRDPTRFEPPLTRSLASLVMLRVRQNYVFLILDLLANSSDALFHPDDYDGLQKVNTTDLVEIAPVDHAQNPRPELPVLLCPCPSKSVPSGEVHVDKHIFKEHLKDDECVNVNLVKDIAEKKIGLVEMYIKDYYISRIDMRVVTTELTGRCLVENQSLKINSFSLTVKHLVDSSGKTIKKGGIVTKDTRFAFRSASALFYLFIQISEGKNSPL